MNQSYPAQAISEAIGSLETFRESDIALHDLRLCAICMQWACNNPECRNEIQCDLQAQAQAKEPAI